MRDAEFERLYEEHARALLAFLVYRTGDRALAEDLHADTFERVLRARRSPSGGSGAAKQWLYTIALNLLRDHARRNEIHGRVLARISAPHGTVEDDPDLQGVEARDVLLRSLASLAPEEHETISLRHGAELTLPQIARVTGAKRTTNEGRYYRALRKLKRELQPPSED